MVQFKYILLFSNDCKLDMSKSSEYPQSHCLGQTSALFEYLVRYVDPCVELYIGHEVEIVMCTALLM